MLLRLSQLRKCPLRSTVATWITYNKDINQTGLMSKSLFVDTVYEREHKLGQALQENYDRNGYSSDTVFDLSLIHI